MKLIRPLIAISVSAFVFILGDALIDSIGGDALFDNSGNKLRDNG